MLDYSDLGFEYGECETTDGTEYEIAWNLAERTLTFYDLDGNRVRQFSIASFAGVRGVGLAIDLGAGKVLDESTVAILQDWCDVR